MRGYRVERWDGTGKPDGRELSQQLRNEGYSVFEWSDLPGAVYADHEHTDEQSHWIISGTLELTVHGHGTVTLNAGDRDLMPPGTRHSARVVGGEPVVYLIGSKK